MNPPPPKVVVVVAACGYDRVTLLKERALASISHQTHTCDRVIIVSDNNPENEPLQEDDIKACFDENMRAKVSLVANQRTKGRSGTGAWNTGILKAYEEFGEDCWVAILDDDDEWQENHVLDCVEASSAMASCEWVVSGIIRRSNSSGAYKDSEESLPMERPEVNEFFWSNPGIQGSNIFVKCKLLLQAGLFDEALHSTTDRDLCIRLCDVLGSRRDNTFASTGKYTVIHYAEVNRSRVSTRGSNQKVQGLKAFFKKHGPRMDEKEVEAFRSRAKNFFDCGDENFESMPTEENQQLETATLKSWSGDDLPLNYGTICALKKYAVSGSKSSKKLVVFGIISSSLERLQPLLRDLAAASKHSGSNFKAFVVIFTNSRNKAFEYSVEEAMRENSLSGHVIKSSDPFVLETWKKIKTREGSKDMQLEDNDIIGSPSLPRPICEARTVLQAFIYNNSSLFDDPAAVVVLDDDKRLPYGWSPLPDGPYYEYADVQIGRDLRTPPNPTLMSMRTQILDLIYSLDFYHSVNDTNTSKDFFKFYNVYKSKFDWYYDFSSSRYDHLEMPVYFQVDKMGDHKFKKILSMLLVGTPLARDVIPLESGHTTQRGGCMVILNKNKKSFDSLALEQFTPNVELSDGSIAMTRRSDSIWCKFLACDNQHERCMKYTYPICSKEDNSNGYDKQSWNIKEDATSELKKSKTIGVNESLYVYHDNRYDKIPSHAKLRQIMVLEICGAILCRDKNRSSFEKKRINDLKCWILRVQGLLQTLRSRPYFNGDMEQFLVRPLEEIFETEKWKKEVEHPINNAMKKIGQWNPDPLMIIQKLDGSNINVDLSDRRPLLEATSTIFFISTGEEASFLETTLYVTEPIKEGDLDIELVAVVKGNINGAENVPVRIHSECLTGDVLGSCMCDCGEQKHKFLQSMKGHEHAVFLYIKGHEGRGAGLMNKIKAYELKRANGDEQSFTHIDALHEVGCKSDIRQYDAAICFLKDNLGISSLSLHTNNPSKMKAAVRIYGSKYCKQQHVPTKGNLHNIDYLNEKIEHLGHQNLVMDRDRE